MRSNDEITKVRKASSMLKWRRELDVKLNEARADARSQRDLLDSGVVLPGPFSWRSPPSNEF